jgi:hypothetical protein
MKRADDFGGTVQIGRTLVGARGHPFVPGGAVGGPDAATKSADGAAGTVVKGVTLVGSMAIPLQRLSIVLRHAPPFPYMNPRRQARRRGGDMQEIGLAFNLEPNGRMLGMDKATAMTRPQRPRPLPEAGRLARHRNGRQRPTWASGSRRQRSPCVT